MSRRYLLFAVFALLLVALAYTNRQYWNLEVLVAHEADLRNRVRAQPAVAYGAALLVYVAVSLIPGTTGKAIVYGWLFGLWWGTLIVNCGLTMAAMITFQTSRYLFHDAIWDRYGRLLEGLDRRFERDGPFYLLVLRLIHAPYTLVNYAMGATQISPGGFWWATQLGLLPGNIVLVYAGSRLPSLAQLSERGVRSLLTIELVAALVALSFLPLLVRGVVRRWTGRRFEPHFFR